MVPLRFFVLVVLLNEAKTRSEENNLNGSESKANQADTMIKKSQFEDEENTKREMDNSAIEIGEPFSAASHLKSIREFLSSRNVTETERSLYTAAFQIGNGMVFKTGFAEQAMDLFKDALNVAGAYDPSGVCFALGTFLRLASGDTKELRAIKQLELSFELGLKAISGTVKQIFSGVSNQLRHQAYLTMIGVPFAELTESLTDYLDSFHQTTEQQLLKECHSGKLSYIFSSIEEYILTDEIENNFFYNELKSRFFTNASYVELFNNLNRVMQLTFKIHQVCEGLEFGATENSPLLKTYLTRMNDIIGQMRKMRALVEANYWRMGVLFACSQVNANPEITAEEIRMELEKESNYGLFSSFDVIKSSWDGKKETGNVYINRQIDNGFSTVVDMYINGFQAISDGISDNFILNTRQCTPGFTLLISRRQINATKASSAVDLWLKTLPVTINAAVNLNPLWGYQEISKAILMQLGTKERGDFVFLARDVSLSHSHRTATYNFRLHRIFGYLGLRDDANSVYHIAYIYAD